MRLRTAVSLTEYEGQEDEGFAGRELRQARRANRRAHREQREQEKIREYRRDTRSVHKSQDRKPGRGKGEQQPTTEPAPEPRRFPAVPPRAARVPQAPQGWPPTEQEPVDAPPPDESAWPEDPGAWTEDPGPDEAFVDDAGVAGLPLRRPLQIDSGEPGWGPLVAVGDSLRVQAREGRRAAVIPLRPGLFLVAELPEAQVQPEVGILPILAPLMIRAAARSLVQPVAPAPAPVVLALPGPVAPAPPALGWADASDVAEVIGCQSRGRRRP